MSNIDFYADSNFQYWYMQLAATEITMLKHKHRLN